MFVSVLLTALSALPAAASPAEVLETADAQRISATLTYSARYDQLRAREWIVFVAQCPICPARERCRRASTWAAPRSRT